MSKGTGSEQAPLLGDSREGRSNTAAKHTYGSTIPSQDHDTVQPSTTPAVATDDTGEPGATQDDDNEISTKEVLQIMSGAYIGAILASLDSTLIVALAVPISESFQSLTLFPWLASAFFVANAASQPLAGKLTDIYGRRAGMIWANVLFGLGNLACALARSEGEMIAGRVLAGIGGGGIGPITSFLASDYVPLRRRGLWQSFSNLCFALGSSLGGPIGGVINDYFHWRWAFLFQMPLTVLAIVLVCVYQDGGPPPLVKTAVVTTTTTTTEEPTKEVPKWKRVDYLGAGTLVAAMVVLLTGLNAGGNLVPWNHPLVLTTLPVSFVLLAAFVWVEAYVASEPIIPIGLLANRTVLFACLANWFVSAARFGLFFYIPTFFYVQGLSSSATSLRLIPESVATGLVSLTFGMIMRSTGRYYYLGAIAGLSLCVGIGLTTTFSLNTSVWLPFVSFALVGVGFCGNLSVTLIAMIAAVEHKYQAVVTSASYAFRSTGSTLGITLASVVFQNILQSQLWARLGDVKDADKVIQRVRDNIHAIDDLPDEAWRSAAVQSYIDALHGMFGVLTAVAVVGAGALLLLKEHRLFKKMARDD